MHADRKKVYRLLLFALFYLAINGVAFGQAFVHPGCLGTDADFLRMKTRVEAGAHPWVDSWNFIASGVNETYQDHAQTEVCRSGSGSNNQFLAWDASAVYVPGIKWKVTGETKYADAGVRVLMAWANKCRRIYGDTNAQLIAFNGYQLACAAENLSTYSGWAQADLATLKNWMRNGPDASTGNDWWVNGAKSLLTGHFGTDNAHYWANWDLCNMAQLISIAVLCDDRDLYNWVLNYWWTGVGDGALNHAVYYMHPAPSGVIAQVKSTAATISCWGSARATSYNVKRSTDGVNDTTIASGMAMDHLYTHVGLVPGTAYSCVVSAIVDGTETADSTPGSVLQITDTGAAAQSKRFYRIVLLP